MIGRLRHSKAHREKLASILAKTTVQAVIRLPAEKVSRFGMKTLVGLPSGAKIIRKELQDHSRTIVLYVEHPANEKIHRTVHVTVEYNKHRWQF